MKPTFSLLFSLICLLACNPSQKEKQKTTDGTKTGSDSYLYVYHFKNKYLDINSLKLLDNIPTKNCTEVKIEDLYAPQFREPSDSIFYKNRSYKVVENGDIAISENGKYLKTILNEDKKLHMDNVTGNSIIFSTSSGIIQLLRMSEQYGYHIKKYDADGNVLDKWTIAHTLFIKRKPNEIESIPYLYYFGHTNKEILFSTVYESPQASTILYILDGTQQKLDYSTAGMILDTNNDRLLGVIGNDSAEKHFMVHIRNKTWQIDNPEGNDAVKTVLKDSILYVAMYPVISSGCNVNAYNANTGKLLWKGDVKQMLVAHSKYYNTVYLTLFHDKLILEGDEAYGSYLQVLDFKTGKRLFEVMP